jgi:hypothetical protein
MKPFTDNHIITDILTEEDYSSIYAIVDSLPEEQTVLMERMGQRAYLASLGDDIHKKLEERVQSIYGNDWILNQYQFARYSKAWGFEAKLYPHVDDAFPDHKITFDVQLRSTVKWPIVVEGKEFTLNDNEGLFFSGTDQVHWRHPIKLSDTDVVDMIFCHFSNPSHPESQITDEWKELRAEREQYWNDKIKIDREPVELVKE